MLNPYIKYSKQKIRISCQNFIGNVYKIFFYVFKRRNVIHYYAGEKLKIFLNDPVSEQWYDKNWERQEINYLKNYKLREGATVFNLGAHEGIVALIFSKIVKNSGKIIAVEMDKSHAIVANINKLNNHANNLHIINVAISNKSGRLYYEDDQVLMNEYESNKSVVNSITIDELTESYGKPSLIYIDIEGFEYLALIGAKGTLKTKPNLCIEVHSNHGLEKYGGSVSKIINILKKYKYKLYIAPAIHNCEFVKFSYKNILLRDRFYLIAKDS